MKTTTAAFPRRWDCDPCWEQHQERNTPRTGVLHPKGRCCFCKVILALTAHTNCVSAQKPPHCILQAPSNTEVGLTGVPELQTCLVTPTGTPGLLTCLVTPTGTPGFLTCLVTSPQTSEGRYTKLGKHLDSISSRMT